MIKVKNRARKVMLFYIHLIGYAIFVGLILSSGNFSIMCFYSDEDGKRGRVILTGWVITDNRKLHL